MLQLVTLRARPDLRAQIFAEPFRTSWPAFMMHDATAELYFAEPNFSASLDTAFAVIDTARPDTAVGRAFAVLFAFNSPGRTELPETGWDGVIRWAYEDRTIGRTRSGASALEITLLPEHRGQGGSAVILRGMAEHLRRLGHNELFVPVRPTAKHLEPLTPMAEYAHRKRPDGLPTDPWLRVHVRAGGTIVKIAPESMVVTGTIADWTSWTGRDFTSSGQHLIPGALSPVHLSLEANRGVYTEPNVWVRHALRP